MIAWTEDQISGGYSIVKARVLDNNDPPIRPAPSSPTPVNASWTAQASTTVENLYAVHGEADNNVYATGDGNGTANLVDVVHYDGTSWSVVGLADFAEQSA